MEQQSFLKIQKNYRPNISAFFPRIVLYVRKKKKEKKKKSGEFVSKWERNDIHLVTKQYYTYDEFHWKNGHVRYDLFAACAWHTHLIFRYAIDSQFAWLVKRFRGSAFLPCRAVKSVQRLPTFQGLLVNFIQRITKINMLSQTITSLFLHAAITNFKFSQLAFSSSWDIERTNCAKINYRNGMACDG